jgi:hypothetical protein
MFLEGSQGISVVFNETNSTRKFELINVSSTVGDLFSLREHHYLRLKFMVESLRLTYFLKNSLAISDIPDIYPEDGDAVKLRKYVASTQNAPQISLKLTDQNNIEMAVIPLTWKGMPLQMNLLKPWLIAGDSGVLLLGENQRIWAELVDDGYGLIKPPRQLDQDSYDLDYVQIIGTTSYTISGVKKNRIITSKNIGVDVPSSAPVQVLAKNDDRCKLIIQNNSQSIISIAFANFAYQCEKNNCLQMNPGATFNEELFPCNPLPIYAIAHSGSGRLLIREDSGIRV